MNIRGILAAAALLLAGLSGHAAAQCTTTFTDNNLLTAAQLNACFGQALPHAATNTALKAVATTNMTASSRIFRDGFAAAGDGGSALYTYSTSACSLSSGAGDNGSQVKPTDSTGCWLIDPAWVYDVRIWGFTYGATCSGTTATGLCFYVNSAGNDASGNNTCLLVASPCATGQQAVNQAQKFDVRGYNAVIHDTDTVTWNDAESIAVTNPLRGAGNGTAVPTIGSLWPSQIIFDGNSHWVITGAVAGTCYGIAASNNAIVGVRNMTIAPTAAACQDGLFAQLGGGFNVFDGMTFGATGANGCKAHAENSAYGIQFWQAYTITGNGNCGYSAGAALIQINAGVGTISGAPTLSELVFVSSGGVFQTNIANPWGASPGTLTGGGFIAAPGGSIESNGLAVAWPGSGSSFLEGGSYDQPPAPAVSSDANIGAGGTVAMASGSTPYAGAITITTAGAPNTAGVLTVTFATPLSVRRSNGATSQCRGGVFGGGSGNWAPGAIVQGSGIAAGVFTLTWQNNGVALTAAKTYNLEFSCLSG